MAEHMRIELLDPKYRQQRQIQLDRAKGATLATDTDITRNLDAFASRRSDIFGEDDEVEIGQSIIPEEAEREKSNVVALDEKIWDGHTNSIARTTTAAFTARQTIDEQIAAIHAAKGLTGGARYIHIMIVYTYYTYIYR